ncbi:uncharacterized protein IL334_005115 [Kwoniella shivajii]|uniref:P-loop containing nucleoside triphosphate hydrolase protein n=1 Tax=Kwoniella shivajii TaxID=564305 RepID=A0ABZ1D285_9TREE|nr:hypothetical protein IL334_005115 [Kwoniella shivajii]
MIKMLDPDDEQLWNIDGPDEEEENQFIANSSLSVEDGTSFDPASPTPATNIPFPQSSISPVNSIHSTQHFRLPLANDISRNLPLTSRTSPYFDEHLKRDVQSTESSQPASKRITDMYNHVVSDQPLMTDKANSPPPSQMLMQDESVAVDDETTKTTKQHDPVAPVKSRVKLVSKSRLISDAHRKCFKFPVFNEIQSAVFEDVYCGDTNVVVAAPTGAGKTTIFELAFLRTQSRIVQNNDKPLSIYMAPTKSQDWQKRFAEHIGVICSEITGDCSDNFAVNTHLKRSDLVVTTPEKLDSITRGRAWNHKLIGRLELIMIDEVHILGEDRGATMEVVISRIKQSKPSVRIIAFGEEYRPVPLKREVYGIEGGGNEWALAPKLDRELFPLLLKHGEGKPVLVFCPTRRSCQTTADLIFKLYEESRAQKLLVPWHHKETDQLNLKDNKLAALSTCGIAVHHAGLDYADRKAIEQGFIGGKLHMIVATSTLAVGVNLPAHTVVIKGTMAWHGPVAGFQEYSDIDIQQMMGRAGRPQFDKTGTVVVMCEKSKVKKYQSMLYSESILESCLHRNLTEHVNCEIGLGTITTLGSAHESFLYIRIQQKPNHYAKALEDAGSDSQYKSWEEYLYHYIEESLSKLVDNGFVQRVEMEGSNGDYKLIPTQEGEILRRSMIAYHTMQRIMTINEDSTLLDLLEILAGAYEYQDLRIRPGEAKDIKYKLDETVASYADKVFILLQAQLASIQLDEDKKTEATSPLQTQMVIFVHAGRIAKAILQVAALRKYGKPMLAALELFRAIAGKAWDDSASVFRQLENVGPVSIRNLVEAGIRTFDQLLALDTHQTQQALKKKSYDLARDVRDQARRMPRFIVSIEEVGVEDSSDGDYRVLNLLLNAKPLSDNILDKDEDKKRRLKPSTWNWSILLLRQDYSFIVYIRKSLPALLKKKTISYPFKVDLNKRCDKIIAVVGVEYVTNLSDTVYPENMEDPNLSGTISVNDEGENDEEHPLPNVPCHHSCQDTNTCGHACCKDGVAPKPTAKVKSRIKSIQGIDTADKAHKPNSHMHVEKIKMVDQVATPTHPVSTPALRSPLKTEGLFLSASSSSEIEVLDATKPTRVQSKSKTSSVSADPSSIGSPTSSEKVISPNLNRQRNILSDDVYELIPAESSWEKPASGTDYSAYPEQIEDHPMENTSGEIPDHSQVTFLTANDNSDFDIEDMFKDVNVVSDTHQSSSSLNEPYVPYQSPPQPEQSVRFDFDIAEANQDYNGHYQDNNMMSQDHQCDELLLDSHNAEDWNDRNPYADHDYDEINNAPRLLVDSRDAKDEDHQDIDTRVRKRARFSSATPDCRLIPSRYEEKQGLRKDHGKYNGYDTNFTAPRSRSNSQEGIDYDEFDSLHDSNLYDPAEGFCADVEDETAEQRGVYAHYEGRYDQQH